MLKILSVIVTVLLIILTPPAVLAFATQDSVPGDFRYPIKRKLEEGILFLASVHPVTKSYFQINRTQRRFTEAKVLISSGKQASTTLSEFVGETKSAASTVKSVSNQTQKRELASNLSKSITEYDKEFETLEKNIPKKSSLPSPKPSNTAKSSPNVSPIPSETASPEPALENKNQELSPEEIKTIREELKRVQDELQKEIIVKEPLRPATQPNPSGFSPEVQDVGDLDKYLGDLYNLNVSSVKLILPE